MLEPLLVEALVQFAGMGFEAIALVNGHFGLENSRLVRKAAIAAMTACPVTVVPIEEYEVLLDLGADPRAGARAGSRRSRRRPDVCGAKARRSRRVSASDG